jgi:ABC-type nitrate/sulfonate/bicarbonate transport system substrate-binding protein
MMSISASCHRAEIKLALTSGSVDAWATWEPCTAHAETGGHAAAHRHFYLDAGLLKQRLDVRNTFERSLEA